MLSGIALAHGCSLAPTACPALDLGAGRTLEFASVDQGARMLGASDEFVERMSPFDRAARLKSGEAVSREQYLAFVAKNVLAWEDSERAAVEAALGSVRERLVRYLPALPKTVYLVKTTGSEEGEAAYTRGLAIVIPKKLLGAKAEGLASILSHELFHVMSRHDAALRERLYGSIGFEACPEVALPADLAPLRITNPDAPRNDHCIRVRLEGEPVCATPVLYADAAYDTKRGGEFFNYMQFQMLVPGAKGSEPRLVGLGKLTGFSEQVGTNTDYVIHPEEILAENFALLVLDRRGLKSPEVPERLRKILEAPR